ncbi:MAG: glycoside hydrolase family 2, partial [Bacteroidales bacterium]|nr:glycoside hydrolase family 2 [Bacteroidales bacterium]
VFARWADSLGVQSRAQAYGRGFFPLESSMCVSIPEGESWTTNYLKHKPGEEMSETDYRRGRAYTMINKYVSSAAHLNGKRIVSCEEMTNTYRVFNMTLQELKLGGDQTVCSGITGTVFHGFNYMPQDAPFPGWIRYGAYYNERNPWWPYFHLYNDYKARLYTVLQNCENVADIAILTPTADMWGKMGMQNEPFPSAMYAPYQTLIWEAIVKNGGSCDYVSERILRQARIEKGNICYGTRKYGTLFLINVESVSPETAEQLRRFVASGGRVVCVETEPCRSLGMHPDNAAADARVAECMKAIRQYGDRYHFVHKPDSNYIAWYAELQDRLGLPHALTFDAPNPYVMQVHYRTADGNDVFFISNSHRYRFCLLQLEFDSGISKGKRAFRWDPETGERIEFSDQLFLEPAGSCLLVFEKKGKKAAPAAPLVMADASEWRQLDKWEVELRHCRNGSVRKLSMEQLRDIREVDSSFAGTVIYRTQLPLRRVGSILLELGRVEGISEC